MKYTKLGIGYIEGNDRVDELPKHLHEIVVQIDMLLNDMLDRIETLENDVRSLKEQDAAEFAKMTE